MNIDLRQLRVFIAVARLGNFTRAAERLNLSQPNLSLLVRRLEQTLGVRLFDRSTRSVTLTVAGQEFLPTAERLVEEFDGAIAAVTDLAARRRGRVTVAALPSIAATLLPKAIAELSARHPQITVSLRDDVADQILARVRSGEVDFGVGATDMADSQLVTTPLIEDVMVAVFDPTHALAGRRRLTWRCVADYPLIGMSRDSSVRRLTGSAFARCGLVVEPRYEAKYMSTAIGLVASGLGVAVLPSSAALMAEQAGLRSATLHEPVVRRKIGILMRRGRSLSPSASALFAILRGLTRGGLGLRPAEVAAQRSGAGMSRGCE